MAVFASVAALRAACLDLPTGSPAAAAAVASRDARLTKPPGSLGRLESLVAQVAGITGDPAAPSRPRSFVIAAADHGVAARGVSAYPSAVTRQMVATFLAGRAAPSRPTWRRRAVPWTTS